MLCGGFTPPSTGASLQGVEESLEAHLPAVRSRLQLADDAQLHFKSSSTQVVAGVNTKYVFEATDIDGDTADAELVVYRDLEGNETLSSCHWIGKMIVDEATGEKIMLAKATKVTDPAKQYEDLPKKVAEVHELKKAEVTEVAEKQLCGGWGAARNGAGAENHEPVKSLLPEIRRRLGVSDQAQFTFKTHTTQVVAGTNHSYTAEVADGDTNRGIELDIYEHFSNPAIITSLSQKPTMSKDALEKMA